MDIAVVGSNMVDLITYIERMPKQGETLEAPDFQMGCGGKGANQAIAASRLGAEVRMITRVGSDMFAQGTIDNFEKNGIDTTWVLSTEGSSGVAPIFVDQDSNNSILIIKGANNKLSPADIEDAEEAIAETTLVVLQLEIPLETVYATIDIANKHNIPVLLNPAPADATLDPEYVGKCTYFVPNETELSLLVGKDLTELDEIEEAATGLIADSKLEHLLVTLGARGVLWVTHDDVQLIESVTVDAQDTTGAGDAFIGCFAAELSRGTEIADAIAEANLYAANSVTNLGTQTSYLDREAFEQWKESR